MYLLICSFINYWQRNWLNQWMPEIAFPLIWVFTRYYRNALSKTTRRLNDCVFQSGGPGMIKIKKVITTFYLTILIFFFRQFGVKILCRYFLWIPRFYFAIHVSFDFFLTFIFSFFYISQFYTKMFISCNSECLTVSPFLRITRFKKKSKMRDYLTMRM